ncbi:MAG: hypothetical protein KC800_01515 [Candidatus Eremiobacteraeota bacterium]|nr:hypothetical protein [Candidatus Eremiobacteraeota bacterium]
MKFFRERNWMKECTRVLWSVGLWASLAGAAQAQGLAKSLAPHEGMLTGGAVGLLLVFVGLIAWEVIDQKRESRSSLDIAKLAAAAAKKKSSTSAPPSGSLSGVGAGGKSFAPPPPPPPPPPPSSAPAPAAQSASAPPPPPASGQQNPFAQSAPAAPPSGIDNADSTVAFSPPDAGSSGGWADLLQRVRAGEPEAANFGETPAPSTEEGTAPPPGFGESAPAAFGESAPSAFGQSGPPAFGDPSPSTSPGGTEPSGLISPPPAESAASSEAWEALLKRTTGGGEMDRPPTKESDRIQLGGNPQSFSVPDSGSSGPPPAPPSFSLNSQEEPKAPAPSSFQLPGSAATEPPSGFKLPGTDAPSAPAAGSGFKLPGSGGPDSGAPAASSSPFSLPGASAEPPKPPAGAPSFKLPGSEPSGAPSSGGFQLPGQSEPNPFAGGFGGGIDDPSSTLPLSDMFSNAGSSPPSFQMPSSGGQAQQQGSSPFEFPSGDDPHGRTISLDFSQGIGQTPPPPNPKTEG